MLLQIEFDLSLLASSISINEIFRWCHNNSTTEMEKEHVLIQKYKFRIEKKTHQTNKIRRQFNDEHKMCRAMDVRHFYFIKTVIASFKIKFDLNRELSTIL